MGYVPVPPKGSKRGGQNHKTPPKKPTHYKNADTVPEMCRMCDNNYRLGLLQSFRSDTGKIGLYDIDLVLEVDGRVIAIGEYKRFKQAYQEFLIPGFEYVALKKIAKMMRVACFLIVELVSPNRASEYYVWMVDRFERPGGRPLKEIDGKKWAAFDPGCAVRLDEDGLTEWVNTLITGLGGGQ